MADSPVERLTSRQREVLALIAGGKTNPEIAERIGVSFETVKTHVGDILVRLDVASREEAAAVWRAHNRPVERLKRLVSWPVTVAGAALAGGAAVVAAAVVVMGGGDAPPPADDPDPTNTVAASPTGNRPGPTQTLQAAGTQDVPTPEPPVIETTGTVLWNRKFDAILSDAWLRTFGGVTYLSYAVWPVSGVLPVGGVVALDPETGDELWRFETPAGAYPVAAADLADARIYFGTADGTVYALQVTDGRELWRATVPGVPVQVIVTSGLVVAGDADPESFGGRGYAGPERPPAGIVQVLDAGTGELRWEFATQSFNSFVGAQADLVVVSADGRGISTSSPSVVALEVGSGAELWRQAGSYSYAEPVIDHGSGKVYVFGSGVAAIKITDGDFLFQEQPSTGGGYYGTMLLGDRLILPTNSSSIDVRDAGTGALVEAVAFGDCGVQSFEAEGKAFLLACGRVVDVEAGAFDGGLVLSYGIYGGVQAAHAGDAGTIVAVLEEDLKPARLVAIDLP